MRPHPSDLRPAAFAFVCGLVALTSNPAGAACPRAGAAYATSFARADTAWDTRTQAKIAGGIFSIFPGAGNAASFLYHGARFSDGTVCADIALTSVEGDDASAGVVFWATDLDNYYFSNYEPVTKKLHVGHFAKGKYSEVGTLDVDDATASGKPIELSVTVRGVEAIVFVDGSPVLAFPGDHAERWYAGLHGESASGGAAVWSVSDFSVTK